MPPPSPRFYPHLSVSRAPSKLHASCRLCLLQALASVLYFEHVSCFSNHATPALFYQILFVFQDSVSQTQVRNVSLSPRGSQHTKVYFWLTVCLLPLAVSPVRTDHMTFTSVSNAWRSPCSWEPAAQELLFQ